MQPDDLDRSDAADARRLRWLLNGHEYFLEEDMLPSPWMREGDEAEMDRTRRKIDEAMKDG